MWRQSVKTIKKIKTRCLVHIVWADSQSPGKHGWLAPRQIDTKMTLVDSVGYVAQETADTLTLVSHLTQDGLEGMGWMTIPKAAIVKRSLLSI